MMLFAEDYLINGRQKDAVTMFIDSAELANSYGNFALQALAMHRAVSLKDGQQHRKACEDAWKQYGVTDSVK